MLMKQIKSSWRSRQPGTENRLAPFLVVNKGEAQGEEAFKGCVVNTHRINKLLCSICLANAHRGAIHPEGEI